MKMHFKYLSVLLLMTLLLFTSINCVYGDEAKENLYGTWTEPDSGRIRMQVIPGSYKAIVDGEPEHDLFIRVNWSSSASEETEYLLSADKAEDADVYTYENGVISNCVYTEDGSVQKEIRTEATAGTITVSAGEDGTTVLDWEDSFGENPVSVQLEQLTMGVPGSDKPIWGEIDYSDKDYWVSFPYNDATDDTFDVFLIEPTVNMKDMVIGNENILKTKTAHRFQYTFNMEKGIFGDRARIYCPLYRQKNLGCYLDDPDSETANMEISENPETAAERTEIAYNDVKAAFTYYLENANGGRPFVLFGYSQGAEMLLNIMKEMGDDPRMEDQLIAAYLIGWKVTEEDLTEYPHLNMAQGADDTGVIVCFDCIDDRAQNPDYHTFSINPLNWKTDDTPASPEENLGYVWIDTDGVANQEIPQYCGAYIDSESGMIRITDMNESLDLYNQEDGLFPQGYYHRYDLNLFYRNIQQNITDRVEAKNSEISR